MVEGQRLVILCGLPGSGKTTHAYQVLNEDPDSRIVSIDAELERVRHMCASAKHASNKAEKAVLQRTQHLLAGGVPLVVVDSTALTLARRLDIRRQAPPGTLVEVLAMKTPSRVCRRRRPHIDNETWHWLESMWEKPNRYTEPVRFV